MDGLGIGGGDAHARFADRSFVLSMWAYAELVDPHFAGAVGCAYAAITLVSSAMSSRGLIDLVSGIASFRLRGLGGGLPLRERVGRPRLEGAGRDEQEGGGRRACFGREQARVGVAAAHLPPAVPRPLPAHRRPCVLAVGQVRRREGGEAPAVVWRRRQERGRGIALHRPEETLQSAPRRALGDLPGQDGVSACLWNRRPGDLGSINGAINDRSI
ncbi:hypothetical protein THAOC_32409 [Thalassiosira oceanica]|uniref:Uncharacterized protein n=1 Tax=Thalassiosira oceanica TaxID=159749 RepID=K0RIQ3_THAOC|nr:hypothetical protein THAOC_32409 [Thalassiosira oceanica]|eukprot:EJK48766.1 hypothetical protein THAOC_32409 [Thalassiosira oceanica]